ncbi:phage antirepressor KilAC domain-containing protein [Bacillus mojavensis]|uniref:phage antirepressor KilAC domain-containing protein n=1 Tax=Bacillus mojavensis TaxID=72360 RepID=UPI002DB84E0A|nr:phage antirepressor KilAC domain-containing protein [Bacillus mojavensis]MEC1734009.1 phage antirepressor KilAC domain-containing protein [Bacillus mojavensis]MED1006490.1 phage antirepressor KilAC domain-containing protein [Bacillus mojavensis]
MTIYNADNFTGITGDHESLLGSMLVEKEDKQLEIIDQRELLGHKFKIYGTYEEPLFLAKDVATWINHSNARMMIQSVEEDEKKCVNNPYALQGQSEQWFLTEDGLYEVLMQSRKPIAKEFKKEVKQILKTIRKTGGFIANADLMVNTYFSELDDYQKTTIRGLFVNVNKLQNKAESLEQQVIEDRPKVEKYHQFLDADGCMDMGTLAKNLNCGMGKIKLFRFLREHKVLMQGNVPYQRYVNSGYFKVITKTTPVGNKLVTLVTAKGSDFIADLIRKSA